MDDDRPGTAHSLTVGDDLLVRVSGGPARSSSSDDPGRDPGGKRAAIVRAATELFLRQGYQATSTEQIAAAASVSKQTVYNHFENKLTLFRNIVLGVTVTAEQFAAQLAVDLADVDRPDDVDPALRALARRYLAAVMRPQVLALRRLVISEAIRLPDLASDYYQRAPARVLAALAEQLGLLADRGLLAVPDPLRAADDFAFLVLGRPLDEGLFHSTREQPTAAVMAQAADHAVDVFLAAYPPRDG